MANTSQQPDYPFTGLDPEPVWKHFAALCSIPRKSKNEEAVRAHLQQWADSQGLENLVDKGGNLIIRKPASPGRENAPGIIVQGHLDMVCQKNEGVVHDFSKDPIRPVIRGGLVLAENTTLGADDGIGVALGLALLEDKTLAHGPLEALFTVDEEEGMGGANLLESGILKGKVMLNLDSETWADFCLGCAGGADVLVDRKNSAEPVPAGWQTVQIHISGLRGGHSGIDIHEGRGNAIKSMIRILLDLGRRFPVRLSSLTGGTAHNALPREAFAVIAVEKENAAKLVPLLSGWEKLLKDELSGVDEGLSIDCRTVQAEAVLSEADQAFWLHTLHAAPHGVWRARPDTGGLPESSNNLGTAGITPDRGECSLMVRSTRDSACLELADEIASLFALSGVPVNKDNVYPGWTPDLKSPLLALCREVYRREFGSDPATHVIHAGLECGILKSKYPDLDIISFGPTINSPHAPGESVVIDTVEKCWRFLKVLASEIK